MVRTSVLGKRRMHKKNANRTVPLDAVPERRTKRCSPRFRPGDRFCELIISFRYLSPGSEGEKCQPLENLWQIPFTHSTRHLTCSNCIYIKQRFSYFILVLHLNVSSYGEHFTITHAPLWKHSFQHSELISKSCCVAHNNNNNNNNNKLYLHDNNNIALQKRRKHDTYSNLAIKVQHW